MEGVVGEVHSNGWSLQNDKPNILKHFGQHFSCFYLLFHRVLLHRKNPSVILALKEEKRETATKAQRRRPRSFSQKTRVEFLFFSVSLSRNENLGRGFQWEIPASFVSPIVVVAILKLLLLLFVLFLGGHCDEQQSTDYHAVVAVVVCVFVPCSMYCFTGTLWD